MLPTSPEKQKGLATNKPSTAEFKAIELNTYGTTNPIYAEPFFWGGGRCAFAPFSLHAKYNSKTSLFCQESYGNFFDEIC